eukprot:TRINITY_DN25424_c0_g1_i1.p1 TRINITY_DN25424_c0_g1~~TRINITY_DN25424_c0_g1_i1.p1  ORF type:complete len:202 (-),score=28.76 TRINITY_DN25424_c0_g1_i1:50-589(-)
MVSVAPCDMASRKRARGVAAASLATGLALALTAGGSAFLATGRGAAAELPRLAVHAESSEGYHIAGLSSLSNNGARKPSAPVSHGTFDMDEYGGLYRRLEKETWPSTMRLVAVGPIGDEFREAVEASVVKVLGWDPVDIEVEKRSRWQSIRMKVRCITPDDFCALHSYLKTVDGVKSVL